MASLNRKLWEWRRAWDCTLVTSLALFQFQPQFSLFMKRKKAERERERAVWGYLPLPLLHVLSSMILPQPKRKWNDWHSLMPIDSLLPALWLCFPRHLPPPFPLSLSLAWFGVNHRVCSLPELWHKLLLHCLREKLNTQRPSHLFLIFPLTAPASLCPSVKLYFLSCSFLSNTFLSLLIVDTPLADSRISPH